MTGKRRTPTLLPLLLGGPAALAGCGPTSAPDKAPERQAAPAAGPVRAERPAPALQPAAPGTPSRLPDERTPVSEAPFDEKSAEGAAQVVQTYFALIEAGKYAGARRLWGGGGEASGKTEADFAADFSRYRDYHAEVGAPGRMEGAAGSSFVTVPVMLYGRLKDGTPFRHRGEVTLRRVNDVPGSTKEQRRWHISDIAAVEAPSSDPRG